MTSLHSHSHVVCRPQEQGMLPTIMCPGSSQWPRAHRWGRRSRCVLSRKRTRSSSTSIVTTATLTGSTSQRQIGCRIVMVWCPAVGVSLT